LNKFEPHLDGFQLTGATIRVEADAKVRPLANMNYKNAEEKVKVISYLIDYFLFKCIRI
jgi:hypothetical protein